MKIYLATPYSHPNKTVMESRFKKINAVAGEIMSHGHIVFSPISHTHPIAVECDLPRGWDFWEKFDRAYIEWCDELWVYMADGWGKSKGVNAEIDIANEMQKPVRYFR